MKCFQKYIFDHKSFPTCKQCEKTRLGFIIFENKKLVRLLDFHPIHNSLACAVGSSVTTSSTDFSFQNLVFWNLFEVSAADIT
jgi:hypothetical protein